MTDLGDLGTVRPVEDPLTFGYFGQVLRTNPDVTDLALVDLIENLEMADGATPVAAIGLFRTMLAALVHPDDVTALWETAKANRQSAEDIGDVCEQIIEALVARPTQQPSASSGGRLSTGPSSSGDSSSRAIDLLERKGRPDLAVFPLQAAAYLASA